MILSLISSRAISQPPQLPAQYMANLNLLMPVTASGATCGGLVFELSAPAQRAERPDLLGELGDDAGELVALGRRDPLETHAAVLEAELLEQLLHERVAAGRAVVAVDVVAVTGVAAGDDHAVGALGEGLHDVRGFDAARAVGLDGHHVRRVLEACRAGQVGAVVAAPTAQEPDQPWFESVVTHCRLLTVAPA